MSRYTLGSVFLKNFFILLLLFIFFIKVDSMVVGIDMS